MSVGAGGRKILANFQFAAPHFAERECEKNSRESVTARSVNDLHSHELKVRRFSEASILKMRLPAALHSCAYTHTHARADIQLADATRIVVCSGHLCSEQEDGWSAAELLAALREKADELPCEVEESGCLSACGVGAMCSIDFEDGTNTITAGAPQCFSSLGIEGTVESTLSGVVVPTAGRVVESAEVHNDGLDALARMRASRDDDAQERPAWATFLAAASDFVDSAKEKLSSG